MLLESRLGGGDDLRAVNQLMNGLTDNSKLSHGGGEGSGHLGLVVNERLPRASSTRVVGKSEIGLETHFTDVEAFAEGERRSNLTYKTVLILTEGMVLIEFLPVLLATPGTPVPFNKTSKKTWESNSKGVESKGTAAIVGSTWSDLAIV